MARLHFVSPALVLALFCSPLPGLAAASDILSGDAVSMMQTRSVARIQRQQASDEASNQMFKSVNVPTHPITRLYKQYVAQRTEVSDLPANLSVGQMLAYDPITAQNTDLFVFLPGSHVHCGNYTQLLESAAESMKVLCLPYDNDKQLYDICHEDSECWLQQRVEAISGSFEHVDGNDIILRLRSALEYLNRTHSADGWAKFIAGPTDIKWDKIRVSGHSQGAGAAAMLGYQHKVARVVQFSGPCDRSDWTEAMHSETPSDRFFGASSYFDRFCDWDSYQIKHWGHEGIVADDKPPAVVMQENLTAYDPSKAQTILAVLTHPNAQCEKDGCFADPPPATMTCLPCYHEAHDSIALDIKWGAATKGLAPYAGTGGMWQKLIGIVSKRPAPTI